MVLSYWKLTQVHLFCMVFVIYILVRTCPTTCLKLEQKSEDEEWKPNFSTIDWEL